MRANVGDLLLVESNSAEQHRREGEIIEVQGPDGQPPSAGIAQALSGLSGPCGRPQTGWGPHRRPAASTFGAKKGGKVSLTSYRLGGYAPIRPAPATLQLFGPMDRPLGQRQSFGCQPAGATPGGPSPCHR